MVGAPGRQLAWCERSAIAGLLALVRPKLSIEIGGRLDPLAAHSGEVHAFDQVAPPPSLLGLAHVHFHTGDSDRLLADCLQRFVEEGRNVDFALVNGDRSGEGVHKNLVTLLESRATADTVIVLYNTMNEHVRSGIERAGVEGNQKVVAFEVNAIPGCLLMEGKSRGELCGGLGIIQTSSAYGRPERSLHHTSPARSALAALKDDLPASDRHRHESSDAVFSPSHSELQDQLDALQVERDWLAEQLARLGHIQALHTLTVNSRSWKVTSPLRDVAAAIRTRRIRTRRGTRRTFVENLRLLNDTLAETDLADGYWVWGGLLVGWAREGKPLANDLHDADFCVLARDVPRFATAVPALVEAGFAPLQRWFTSDGRETAYAFVRDGIRFDFSVLDPVDGHLCYYLCASGPTQALAAIPDQALVPFEFVGRTWHKHADHEAELTAMYGDWRTPDPDWWFMNDYAIVERSAWTRAGETHWDGGFGDMGLRA